MFREEIIKSDTRPMPMDSLLGFAFADPENLSLLNFLAHHPATVPAESLHPIATTSSEPLSLEAVALQVLTEIDDGFSDFDASNEVFDSSMLMLLEPVPTAPSVCSSSNVMVVNQQNKRLLDQHTPDMVNQQQAHQQHVEQPPTKRQRCVSPASEISFEDPSLNPTRFRDYQAEQWTEKFEELCAFVKGNGHCQVPHGYSDNQSLARWTKRQRYQYKLKNEKKSSTMTDDRIAALNALGFIWNSHGAVWEERLNELRHYVNVQGHCNVPSQFDDNQKLATWVKCQRRQYKLFMAGKRSNMTVERVQRLQRLGFVWEIRCHGPPK